MRLSENILHVRSPESLGQFYRRCLGARVIADQGAGASHPGVIRVEFGSAGSLRRPLWDAGTPAGLELRAVTREAGAAQGEGRVGPYWKIGLTHPDVDRMRAALVDQAVAVSDPAQFLDVGYLCHFADPEGFEVELLQQTFADSPRRASRKRLTNQLTLGQITLRVRDAEQSLSFYREVLGMQLLSRQVIEPHRFTLYFLGCREETLPDPDIDAVANREWLWQRPYTTLELQHRWDGPAPLRPSPASGHESVGFFGIGLTVERAEQLVDVRRRAVARKESRLTVSPEPDSLLLHDPDGNWIRLRVGGE